MIIPRVALAPSVALQLRLVSNETEIIFALLAHEIQKDLVTSGLMVLNVTGHGLHAVNCRHDYK